MKHWIKLLTLFLMVFVTGTASAQNVAAIGDTGYESLQAAVDDAYANMTGNVTINLTSDITANTVVRQKLGVNLTIDGGNKTITGQILIDGVGNYGSDVLIIQNIKFTGNTSNFVSAKKDAFIAVPDPKTLPSPYTADRLSDGHNITISNCTFTSTSPNGSYDVVGFKSESSANVNGLTISNCTGTNLHSFAQLTGTTNATFDGCTANSCGSFIGVNGGGGTYNISNCEFPSSKDGGYAIRIKEGNTATVNLTNNDLTATDVILIDNGKSTTTATINVVSGSYKGNVTNKTNTASLSITDGTIFTVPVDNYLAEGHISSPNGDGTYTVKQGAYIAQIGNVKYADLQTDFNAAQDGETVKLLTDVDATSTMYSGDNRFNLWVKTGITVDGNGHMLTVKGRGIGVQGASSNIDVTFKDITVKNVGNINGRCIDTRGNLNSLTLNNATITTTESTYTGYLQPLTIGGNQSTTTTVNITNSNIIVVNDANKGYAITTFNPVNMTIDGSTLKGWACLNIKAADSSAGSNGSVFTITNSELTSKNVYSGESNDYSVIKIEDVDVTVNVTSTDINVIGTNNTQAIVGFEYGNTNGSIVNLGEGNNVTFTGTTVFAQNDNAASNLLISGGTFNEPVPEQNCAEGYIPADLGNGKYSVKVGSYVAQIGDTKYETLAAAIDAATDGANTITLLKDIDLGSGYANINKAVTINGDGHTIISTAGAAVEVHGTGDVTISNTKINATSGRGVQVGNLAHYSGKLTINNGTEITVAKRGINVLDVDAGFELNIDGSIVQSNVADPLTTYTTGDDSRGINFSDDSRGINFSNDPLAYNANITNSEIRGFSYNINVYSGTQNLTVNMTGGKTYGRAAVNNWGDNNTFNLDGVEVHGLNNETGPTEGFACIVENNTGSNVAENNTYNIKDCTFSGSMSEAAQSTTGSSATEYMLALRGNNTKVVVTGSTTYTTNSPARGGIIENENQIENNKILMDETVANAVDGAFENYKVVTTDETPGYTLAPKTFVAQIGDVKYETLEAAWNAVQDGETITLLADCAGNGIKAPQGKFTQGVTIDFGGFTYTMDGAMVGSTGTQTQAFQLLKDNNITFKNGTIYSEKAKMLVQNYSNLTLESMTLTLNNTNYSEGYTLSNNNGNVVIDGSTINANTGGGFAFDVCRYASYPSVSVTVTGESVINGNIEVDVAGGDPKDGLHLTIGDGVTISGSLVLSDGTKTALNDDEKIANTVIKKNGNVTLAAPADYKWKDNGDGTSTLVPCEYVAQIGDVKYETLAEAVAAVPADNTETTIEMIANEMINVVGYAITIPANKNVVIDLNGHEVVGTVEQEGTSALIRNLGTLTIKDSSDAGTGKLMSGATSAWTWDGTDDYSGSYASNLIRNEKNLTVVSGLLYNMSTGSASYAIDNYSAGNVTIDGGTVDAAKASAIRMFYVNGGSVTVNDGAVGHYNSDTDCTYVGIQVMGGTNANVTVNGGTIAGTYALYANNSGGNIAISDGSFEGNVGFAASVPNISITGGSFNAWVGTWGDQTKFISGGIYAEEVDEEYIADGYILADNTDEATKAAYPFMVKPGAYVAQVGNKKYETLEEALAAITEGSTLTLLANVEMTENYTATVSFTLITGDYTFDSNRHNIVLNHGVSVTTDEQTGMFVVPTGTDYIIKEETVSGGYKYTCMTKEEGGIFELLDLTDEPDDHPYKFTTTRHAESVTYRRTFAASAAGMFTDDLATNKKYVQWFVPVDYTIKSEDLEHLEFFKVHLIAASATSGGEVQYNKRTIFIYLEKLKAGDTMYGNRPYMVWLKDDSKLEFEFVSEDVDLLAIDNSSRLDVSTAEDRFDFYGVYKRHAPNKPRTVSINSKGRYIWMNSVDKVRAYRWYIQATSRTENTNYADMYIFNVEEGNEPTDIDNLNITEDNEIEGIYTIDGKKLDHPIKGLNIIKMKDNTVKKVYIK